MGTVSEPTDRESGGRLVARALKEADVTTDPHGESVRDLSASTNIAALVHDVPVVRDIKDFAVPGVFETDEELDDFLRWYEAERQTNLA